MDKRKLLSSNLARIMNALIPQIDELLKTYPVPHASMKDDGTPVTSLDLALSTLIEKSSVENYPATTVYSEENYSNWDFPLMAIDPLDGTREYIKQRPEWAVSVAHLLDQSFNGEGWIYNPMTNELFSEVSFRAFELKTIYEGEVSHSEWDKDFYKHISSAKFNIKPVGSIAYKLGRLAAGKTDFVVSLAPKNIWDIAAGIVLCKKAGIKCWSQGVEVSSVQKMYLPPLIWCHDELFDELSSLFQPTDKRL